MNASTTEAARIAGLGMQATQWQALEQVITTQCPFPYPRSWWVPRALAILLDGKAHSSGEVLVYWNPNADGTDPDMVLTILGTYGLVERVGRNKYRLSPHGRAQLRPLLRG